MKAKSLTDNDMRPDELAFIKKHGIHVAEVIDVTGMSRIGQKRAMEAGGARVAINGRKCGNGHRLKTRSGHCPQCSPKYLAFERRHSITAHVYVCVSDTGLAKVGMANDPHEREARLCREGYASCRNWRLIFSVKTELAGRIEAEAHRSLERFKVEYTYLKEGRDVGTYESFRCSPEQAIQAVKLAVESTVQT